MLRRDNRTGTGQDSVRVVAHLQAGFVVVPINRAVSCGEQAPISTIAPSASSIPFKSRERSRQRLASLWAYTAAI